MTTLDRSTSNYVTTIYNFPTRFPPKIKKIKQLTHSSFQDIHKPCDSHLGQLGTISSSFSYFCNVSRGFFAEKLRSSVSGCLITTTANVDDGRVDLVIGRTILRVYAESAVQYFVGGALTARDTRSYALLVNQTEWNVFIDTGPRTRRSTFIEQ